MMTKIVDGEIVLMTDDEEKQTTDKWTANKTAIDEIGRVQEIKQQARKRIVNFLPGGTTDNYLEKQNYLHAQFALLQEIQLSGGQLTPEQVNSKNAIRAVFQKMDGIVKLSNSAEAGRDSVDKFLTDLNRDFPA